MNAAPHGGAALAHLDGLDGWEAQLITHIRMWCEGRAEPVRQAYAAAMPVAAAELAYDEFDTFMRTLLGAAHRPLMRQPTQCRCACSDECVLLHLVRTASDGALTDAALIAALLTRPAQAERLALMAGQVGACARSLDAPPPGPFPEPFARRLH